jgi:hypothetical protein
LLGAHIRLVATGTTAPKAKTAIAGKKRAGAVLLKRVISPLFSLYNTKPRSFAGLVLM